MHEEFSAVRYFRSEDQLLFARLSGDFNPMHIDPIIARRTQPGAQVVHGIHAFLWALDAVATRIDLMHFSFAKVQFKKFIYLNRPVSLRIVRRDDTHMQLELMHEKLVLTTLKLLLGERHTGPVSVPAADSSPSQLTNEPKAPSLGEMASLSGWLASPAEDAQFTTLFPALERSIGVTRISAIAQLSTLVGMACPGLHSIFSGFTLRLVDGLITRKGIGWQTRQVDSRFRLASIDYAGSGLIGEASAFIRQEPIHPPSLASLTCRVGTNEFSGVRALIIGGSRGLGAAAAKLLAAGGANITVTYVHGRTEAETLQADINSTRGSKVCDILRYDVNLDATSQLAGLGGFDQLYYFATTHIFQQKSEEYSPALFSEFFRIYVDGFYSCLRAVQSFDPERSLVAFYPSSTALTERPRGMTEYVMAKAAGEFLCADLSQYENDLKFVVHRIPRTVTDQTATASPVVACDPVDVMLPQIRKMAQVAARNTD